MLWSYSAMLCVLLLILSRSAFQGTSSEEDTTICYVDSNIIPESESACGLTEADACSTIAQALQTRNQSAQLIVLVSGNHDSEYTGSLFSREVNITGNYNIENTEDASLRIATANLTESNTLFLIQSNVVFEQLQFIVILDTQFLLNASLFQVSTGYLLLRNITTSSQQYTRDASVLSYPLVNATQGILTLQRVTISNLPFLDTSLFCVSTEHQSFNITENSTFTNIYRCLGNGSVFNVVLGGNDSFELTNATFRNCSTPTGSGGAIYVSITGSYTHFLLTNLTFRAAGEAIYGRCVCLRSDDFQLINDATYSDILRDRHTELFNHFTYVNATTEECIPLNRIPFLYLKRPYPMEMIVVRLTVPVQHSLQHYSQIYTPRRLSTDSLFAPPSSISMSNSMSLTGYSRLEEMRTHMFRGTLSKSFSMSH